MFPELPLPTLNRFVEAEGVDTSETYRTQIGKTIAPRGRSSSSERLWRGRRYISAFGKRDLPGGAFECVHLIIQMFYNTWWSGAHESEDSKALNRQLYRMMNRSILVIGIDMLQYGQKCDLESITGWIDDLEDEVGWPNFREQRGWLRDIVRELAATTAVRKVTASMVLPPLKCGAPARRGFPEKLKLMIIRRICGKDNDGTLKMFSDRFTEI